jgi:hypothetical protein
LHLARTLVSLRSTSGEAAFTSIATLMRGPWSAFSRFWIAGDDPGSDDVRFVGAARRPINGRRRSWAGMAPVPCSVARWI